MAYDEGLDYRIQEVLGSETTLVKKKMFGGVGYLLNGNMAFGVNQDFLIVRVGADAYRQTLTRPFTREFDMTGRAMTGWVVVEPEGFETEEDLADWLNEGINFAKTLPPK